MDTLINDSNGRHVSVIVRPKTEHAAAFPPTSTDVMIKALAGNPWATALMMQYTSSVAAQAALADRYEPPVKTAEPPPLLPNQQQQLLPPPAPPPQAAQTFGALLKAAMRNRNATTNNTSAANGGGAASFPASNALTVSPHQAPPQTPNAVPNRMSYPREFKLLVIGYYFNNGQNKYRTCKEFQITKSMLNGWLQKVDKIQQSRPGSLKSGRSGRKPQFPQVESELYNVYLAYLAQGKKVGNRWLRDTAKCIAQRRCSSDELNGMCQFSERWLCNFKKRFGINLTKDWNDKPSSYDDSASPDHTKSDPQSIDHQTDTKSDDTDPVTSESTQASPDTTVDVEKTPNSPSTPDPKSEMIISNTETPAVVAPLPRNNRSSSNAYEPGKRGRKVQFPQVERALFKKLRDKQIDGSRVSNRWLQDEARRLAVELCPQLFTDTFKSARCMFSEHWLHNFKKRYGITLKQSSSRSDDQKYPDMPLNLSMTATEPVSSSDDVQKNRDQMATAQNGQTNGPIIDDLPTMVPLPMLSKSSAPPPINFAEWYSKITTIMGNRPDSDETQNVQSRLTV